MKEKIKGTIKEWEKIWNLTIPLGAKEDLIIRIEQIKKFCE